MEVDKEPRNAAAVASPLGSFTAHVDEKGRLKLPADLQRFIEEKFSDKRVYVTTNDLEIVQVYPLSLHRQNLQLLESETEDPEGAEDIAFLLTDLGAESEIDAQGRILVPQELRRELKLEKQSVWLRCYKDVIHVLGPEALAVRRVRSRQNLKEKVARLKPKGFR